MFCPGECSMCTWEECVFCCCWMESILLSPFVLKVWFNFNVTLFLFCLEDLSIVDSEVLKSPTLTVLLCISPLRSVSNLLSIFWWGYIYDYCTFLIYWLFCHYIMTFFVSCYPFWLEIYFVWCKYGYSCLILDSVWNIIFYPFSLSLCVLLELRWISFRQAIVGSCFFLIHPASLCLLICKFNTFIFRLITDT